MRNPTERILTLAIACGVACQSGCAMFETKRVVKLADATLKSGDRFVLWKTEESFLGRARPTVVELEHTYLSGTCIYEKVMPDSKDRAFELRVADDEGSVWVVDLPSETVVFRLTDLARSKINSATNGNSSQDNPVDQHDVEFDQAIDLACAFLSENQLLKPPFEIFSRRREDGNWTFMCYTKPATPDMDVLIVVENGRVVAAARGLALPIDLSNCVAVSGQSLSSECMHNESKGRGDRSW